MWERLGRILYTVLRPALRKKMQDSTRSRVIIRSGDKILLSRDWLSSQDWSLPGGGIKNDEQPQAGALRELEEELQIVAPKGIRRLGTFKTSDAQKHTFTVIIFLLELSEDLEFKPRWPEVLEAQWFDPKRLPEQIEPVVKPALDLLES